MRSLRAAVEVIVFTLVLTLGPSDVSAGTRAESSRYLAGAGTVVVCDAPQAGNVGGACFSLDGSETRVSIRLADDAGWAVAGTYAIGNGFFTTSRGEFCDSTTVAVPPDSRTLLVAVEAPGAAAARCLPAEGSVGVPTTGTVFVALGE